MMFVRCIVVTKCQEDVKRKFFDESRAGNDCYVDKYVYDERFCIGVEKDAKKPNWLKTFDVVEPENIVGQHVENGVIWCYDKSHDIVSQWLFENDAEIGSQVIISHDW